MAYNTSSIAFMRSDVPRYPATTKVRSAAQPVDVRADIEVRRHAARPLPSRPVGKHPPAARYWVLFVSRAVSSS
jgi:hypothetical protein